jgi:hypothetical protein
MNMSPLYRIEDSQKKDQKAKIKNLSQIINKIIIKNYCWKKGSFKLN